MNSAMLFASTGLLAFVSALAVAGCGPGDARFTTKVASDFAPHGHVVSVLGVYKDGQMSAGAWETIGPRLSRGLGGLGATACEAGYTEAVVTPDAPTSGALSQSIDDYTRSSGPTDELIAQLAPASKGDLVVVFTVSGQLPTGKPKTSSGGGPAISPTGAGGLRRRTTNTSTFAAADTNELAISASLFSVPLHRGVGLITMQYNGATVDDAVAKFADRLAAVLPDAQCGGWDWSTHLDPDRIRQSIER